MTSTLKISVDKQAEYFILSSVLIIHYGTYFTFMVLGKCFSNGYVFHVFVSFHFCFVVVVFFYTLYKAHFPLNLSHQLIALRWLNLDRKFTQKGRIKITYDRFLLQKQNNTTPATQIKATTPAIMADNITVFSLLVSESVVPRSWKMDRKLQITNRVPRFHSV